MSEASCLWILEYLKRKVSAHLPSLAAADKDKHSESKEKHGARKRGGMSTTMTVELDLERMEKMKQKVLKVIQRMVNEYGNVSVIELELALIEGLAKVREIGIKQMEEAAEESDVV